MAYLNTPIISNEFVMMASTYAISDLTLGSDPIVEKAQYVGGGKANKTMIVRERGIKKAVGGK